MISYVLCVLASSAAAGAAAFCGCPPALRVHRAVSMQHAMCSRVHRCAEQALDCLCLAPTPFPFGAHPSPHHPLTTLSPLHCPCCSMVTPGAENPKRGTPEEVASYTLRMLRRRVPPAVPGIMFLSGEAHAARAAQCRSASFASPPVTAARSLQQQLHSGAALCATALLPRARGTNCLMPLAQPHCTTDFPPPPLLPTPSPDQQAASPSWRPP